MIRYEQIKRHIYLPLFQNDQSGGGGRVAAPRAYDDVDAVGDIDQDQGDQDQDNWTDNGDAEGYEVRT